MIHFSLYDNRTGKIEANCEHCGHYSIQDDDIDIFIAPENHTILIHESYEEVREAKNSNDAKKVGDLKRNGEFLSKLIDFPHHKRKQLELREDCEICPDTGIPRKKYK